jgi:hypothetical protein
MRVAEAVTTFITVLEVYLRPGSYKIQLIAGFLFLSMLLAALGVWVYMRLLHL